ncbi:ComEA family DNA-binding protein [Sphingobacterium faecium]|jgi:hypothetical protein|uniref:ComEA family DNA-binding protein n=1 Tax=Sphingobacterium faecium TaxID=34087 RepID=UPI0004E5F6F3|nr:helix-hairpin-helix domain-containing protein [Sphingobacterium faecium]UXD68356.1 helix-hairpin-helix domain-containing protein [Sphingobacterium faecium]WGQ16059.1 helix-hairpin-helix domain-containing protein [Sphingobacterium faecium]CDS92696.1 conserved exported hypothetical protein [Sphingobacterium sp. PM2-P1-29]SJN50570.1 hypothetical protein FM120_26290 [Sphingobacterium faecium PCAi_F2.5]
MKLKLYLLSWIFLLDPSYIFAQENPELTLDQLFEQLLEELDQDVDASEISERWSHYIKHPINLNTTDGDELQDLLFLSMLQIENLLAHRKESGDFISVQELQSIAGFDVRTVQNLLPFVTVSNTIHYRDFTLKNLVTKAEQEVMLRYGRLLHQAKGYQIRDTTRSRYLGDPNRYLIRYRFNYNNKIRLSINMDKDAGEPFFRDKQRYGFDFYSASLSIRDLGKVKQVVIGDFALQIGQGLTMWNGLSFGKGSMIESAARQGAGLRSYTSLNEANFLRGISGTIAIGRFELTPYISYRLIDGNVKVINDERAITTLAISGLHRTPTEQGYRKAIGQLVYGNNIMYSKNRLKIGGNFVATHLDGSKLLGKRPENKYDFEGNLLRNASVYYNYTFRNSYFFGELATSLDSGYAWLAGAITGISPHFSTVLLYRDYQKNYHSFFAQSMGETKGARNEKGLYTGLVYHPSRKVQWTTYVDIFKFPWLRYRVSEPSSGYDVLSQFSYIWYKRGHLSLRLRYRVKQENAESTNDAATGLAEVSKAQLRLEYRYKLSNVWSIRSRGEGTQYQKGLGDKQYGWMVYQDLFFSPDQSKMTTNLRIAYFHTDSYNTRIYAYENDVLYASSFPLYYQKGWRFYNNVRYRIGQGIDVWAKVSAFYYPGLASIGSGLDVIQGNLKSEIKLQLRFQF